MDEGKRLCGRDLMKFETAAVHAGEEPVLSEGGSGDVVIPIHLASTFARRDVAKPTGGYEYSRSGNPTRGALEQKLAAIEGAKLRLRPILMTSFAFILGVMPLVFATGAGALGRRSVGTTIVGGMVLSTVLNLIFIPVLYVILRRLLGGGDDAPKDQAKSDAETPLPPAKPAEA